MMAKGGGVDNLEKELHRLQRDLNSKRLNTYMEGDTSEEEMARRKERAEKMARFDEVLKLLNERDRKMAKGGMMAKGGDIYWKVTNGTRTIADFPSKKEAEKFIYEYNLKYPKAKLFTSKN